MNGSGLMPYVGTSQVEALALGADGTVYAAAYSNSTTYPVTGGTYAQIGARAIYRLSGSATVQPLMAVVDPAVTTIRALAIDAAGGIYFTGVAGPGLATTANAAIPSTSAANGGPYLIKIAPGGGSIAYATYLSVAGSRNSVQPDPQQSNVDIATSAFALVVDGEGNAYVAGQAKANDFPVTTGAPDTSDYQNRDAFVAKINANGSALVWVARLGGSDAERATSIALAPGGGVVVVGKVATRLLPSVGEVFQRGFTYESLPEDREHGFVAKLAPDGSRWLFVVEIGSAGGNLVRNAHDSNPSPLKVAVDASGAIHVAGNTGPDRELPLGSRLSSDIVATAIQSPGFFGAGSSTDRTSTESIYRHSGAFLMKMTPDAKNLLYSIIVNAGHATGLAVDAYGAAYVVGYGAGAPQVNAVQAAPGNVFVAKVLGQNAPLLLTTSPNPSVGGASVALAASVADGRYAGSIEFRDGMQLLASIPLLNGTATYSAALGVGIHRMTATFVGAGPFNGAQAPEVVHVVNQIGTAP